MFAEVHIERGRVRAVLPSPSGTIIRTETRTGEYPGGHILPGFVDNHAHIVGLGRRLQLVSLHDATSAEECADRLRQAARAARSGTWLQAMGWNELNWTRPIVPTTSMLDDAVGDVPTVAMRVDGHSMWASSEARRASGLSCAEEPLVDDAMVPVQRTIPESTPEELREMIVAATAACVEQGITEVHDMDVHPSWLEPMRALAESGHLPIRVQSFLRGQNHEWDNEGLLPAGGEFLRTIGIKLYADGALGSRGAALHEPYSDAPAEHGFLLLSAAEIVNRASAALDLGWKLISIHAIGDLAVTTVLDAYEVIRERYGYQEVILRMEHAQHMRHADVARMARLHVIACVQPSHCLSDARMAEARLGPDRLHEAYRWQTLLDAGVHIGAGSDFPIEPPSALVGIDAFVRRTPPGMGMPWHGAERISIADAIRAWTLWAQASAGMEYRRGTIAVGMDADLVVLDQDLLTAEHDDILSTQILATWTAGVCRYQK